jgi:transcriptional antiterminator NusG
MSETSAASAAERNWYVIHTYSGYENKVKTNLERRVESYRMQEQIFDILVPMEEELEIKDGKRKLQKRKVFPGYVLVNMIMTDNSWYVVRNTPGVTGFVGSGQKPIPLTMAEVDAIMRQMGLVERPRIRVAIGDAVKVKDGPFSGFVGVVEEIAPERGKVKVLVSMFGRETPVELDFHQVEEM